MISGYNLGKYASLSDLISFTIGCRDACLDRDENKKFYQLNEIVERLQEIEKPELVKK